MRSVFPFLSGIAILLLTPITAAAQHGVALPDDCPASASPIADATPCYVRSPKKMHREKRRHHLAKSESSFHNKDERDKSFDENLLMSVASQ